MSATKNDITVALHYRSNEAPWDRALRGIGGGALLWVGAAPLAGTGLGLLLSTIGAMLLITATVGWCPLYAALRVSTVRRSRASLESTSHDETEIVIPELGAHPPRA